MFVKRLSLVNTKYIFISSFSTVFFAAFKHELAQVLTGLKRLDDLSILEAEMVSQFQVPDPKRKWREGVMKSSFNYLLLDPRVSLNLPMRHTVLSPLEIFRIFVSSIFYIGKGKRARPYAHFYEALDAVKKREKKKNKKQKGVLFENFLRFIICLLFLIVREIYSKKKFVICMLYKFFGYMARRWRSCSGQCL